MNGGLSDFESLDETALLSLGILLEEMAEHVLGDTGDLAFVEGEGIDDPAPGPAEGPQTMNAESSKSASTTTTSVETSDSEVKPKHKRRKTQHTASDDVWLVNGIPTFELYYQKNA